MSEELPSVTIATESEADRFELADSMEAAATLWPMLVRIPYLGEPHPNGSHGHGSVFWRRMTEEHLTALLAALPAEQKGRIVSELINISPSWDKLVDEEADADASRLLEMSDEELDDEIRAGGGDPERLHRWGAATGKWVRKLADLQRELEQEREALATAHQAIHDATAVLMLTAVAESLGEMRNLDLEATGILARVPLRGELLKPCVEPDGEAAK